MLGPIWKVRPSAKGEEVQKMSTEEAFAHRFQDTIIVDAHTGIELGMLKQIRLEVHKRPVMKIELNEGVIIHKYTPGYYALTGFARDARLDVKDGPSVANMGVDCGITPYKGKPEVVSVEAGQTVDPDVVDCKALAECLKK
jgi:hypothetical protein